MRGFRSLDGGAVVMLKIANYHDVIELWAVSLSKSLGIEPVEYTSDRFFSVRAHDIEQGVNFYRYQVQIVDGAGNLFYTLLFDIRGFVKVEIRYGAQRDLLRLNTEYRKLFEYLNIRILEEKVSRVDLAITIEKDSLEVINHVLSGCYNSLLNRKTLVTYGMPCSSVRIGSIKNVEVAIYDKIAELMANSSKLSYQIKIDDIERYFKDAEYVTRIEYRLSRVYLRNVGISTPEDVNKSLFDLYATMQTRYFMPTDSVPDGHHALKPSEWWIDLPPLTLEFKRKERPIMFITDTSKNIFHPSPIWSHAYEMLFSRAQGYLGSIVASMARITDNIDTSLQIVIRRLIKDDSVAEIRNRAYSRFALSGVFNG